jgi:hypothetical protein
MSALLVSANGIPVGTIEIENGRWKFGYAAEWKAYALSPNFPIATRERSKTLRTPSRLSGSSRICCQKAGCET